MKDKPQNPSITAALALGLLAWSLPAATAFADNAPPEDEPAFAALTGDWGGARTKLKTAGIELIGSYTGEFFGNPRGGSKRGGVFDGLLKLNLDVNLEKTMGWPDATLRISGLYPHGTSGTLNNVNDASIFSNIDAYDTVRLVDFWIEQRLIDGRASVKVGQMRVDDEFGVTDSASILINSTFGVPNPPYTPMPIAAYPVGALGIRLRLEPVEGLYGQLGIYDGNPSPGDFGDPSNGPNAPLEHSSRHGTEWSLRSSEGTLYVGEVGFQRCCKSYPGAVRLGFLRHTDKFADVRVSNAGETHRGSTSAYGVVDQTIWQKSSESKEGLSVFLRGTLANQQTSYMCQTTQGGLVLTGVFGSEDKCAIAHTRNRFSPDQNNNPTHESITEITYQLPLKPYLRVQPDVQYISQPGGTTQFNSAWVFGVRATVDF